MLTPIAKPKVTVSRIKGYSLEALRERLSGASNYVKVGLPDSETTDKGDAIRNARKQQPQGKRTR
jgi:hypothetical protein